MITNMIKALFIVATIFFNIQAYSQVGMKEKNFSGIKYFELTNKERQAILEDKILVTREESNGDYIYRLSDDRVVYEMKDIVTFLFTTEDDFDNYMKITGSPEPLDEILQTFTHPIKDSSFIEKRELYITFFAGELELNIDISDIEDLSKVDVELNNLSIEELKKYRLSIIALIGEFIVTNLHGAEWKYLNIPNPQKERSPVVMVDSKTLINPASIFYEEYNKKIGNLKYKIDITRTIRLYLQN